MDRKTIAGRVSIQTLSYALQGVLQFAALVLYSRFLSKEDCGLFAIAAMIDAFGTAMSESGVGSCVVQSPRQDRVFLGAAFWTATSLALVLYAVLFLAAPSLDGAFGSAGLSGVLRWVGATIIMNGIASVPQGILLRRYAYVELMLANVVPGAIGQIVVGGWMAFRGWGIWAPATGLLVYFGLRCMMLCRYARLSIPLPPMDRTTYGTLFRFGIPLVLARLFNLLYQQGDKLVLGLRMPLAFVASFDRAIQLVALPALFLGSILDSVLFPMLSRCQEEHREKALDYAYRSQEVLLVATVPAAVLLCFTAPAATLLLLGRQWETAGAMASILFLSFPFLSLTRLSDCVLRAFGDTRVIFWNKVVGATLALAGLWFGASWGARGAAVSCVAAKAAGAVFALVMTRYRVGLDGRRLLHSFLPALRVTMLLAAVFGALAALLLAFPRVSPALHLAVLVVPGTLVCGAFLLLRADIAGAELESLLRQARLKLTGGGSR